jgi:polyhydroxyalkanoate synthase subunit PhaC
MSKENSPPEAWPNFQTEIDRAIARNIKGLDFLTAPPPSVGQTPKDLIHAQGTLRLYHYRPLSEEVYRVPVLFIMATTNRGYIFDLAPGQSFIEFLLKAGYDVFLMDWASPREDEQGLRMENYVFDFIPQSIAKVQQETGEADVSIIGYCMGGTLAAMYSALHPTAPLKNLVCLTTAIDFQKMGLFSRWFDKATFDVDRLVNAMGNISPEIIYNAFAMLRPASQTAGQLQLWQKMWDDEYVNSYRLMDHWSRDTVPLPGEYFRQIVKELFWKNGLVTGKLKLAGKTVDLSKIKVPLLHAMAEHDHIVPYDTAKPLVAMAGSTDKEEMVLKGGHVSLIAGPNAIKRFWPKVDEWLGERST